MEAPVHLRFPLLRLLIARYRSIMEGMDGMNDPFPQKIRYVPGIAQSH